MLPRHILRVDQFDRISLDQTLAHARSMRQVAERGGDGRLDGKILATLFYEPSTRTRLSFESAMLRLGGRVISAEYASETSSAVKGESIEDTVRIVESYADAIVIRHPLAGVPERGAAVASVPIVNAGDGAREHPTQALLDILTISEELGRIDDLTVAMVGDLRYGRAPRSLAMLLGLTRNCRLVLVAPPGIEMAHDVLRTLSDSGMQISFERDLMEVAESVDVVYVTRVQRERFPTDDDYRAARGTYRFTGEHLSRMKRDSIVMHPLPRLDEVDPEVDEDPRSAYFRQARNGVFLRMALLDLLMQPRGVTV
jgi:aspartate carbamoyltransferase catalytic subunit